MTVNLYTFCRWLVISWFVCGAVATIAGFFGLFYPPLTILLIIPVTILGALVFFTEKAVHNFTYFEKIIAALILTWWILHLFQVFTPETGFDAVWYHLPLAQQTLESHRFVGTLSFYQSFNPQFTDSIFYLGYALAGEIGAKAVAFGFGLSLLFVSYALSRTVLNRTWSLIAVLFISGFQVISWQVSSFYIDLAKAFWELSAVWLLIKGHYWQSGLALGGSIASKAFSIVLMPLFDFISWLLYPRKIGLSVIFLALLIAVPFYLFAFSVSGNPLYSIFLHTGKMSEIGGVSSFVLYLWQQTIRLPLAVYELVVTREYTSPLIILLFPLVWIFRKEIVQQKRWQVLLSFTLFELLIWWFIPPISVRYALAGFVTGLIMTLVLLREYVLQKKVSLQFTFMVLLLLGVVFMPIRIWVAARSSVYIFGLQNREQYLEQFMDGNIDQHLEKWEQLK